MRSLDPDLLRTFVAFADSGTLARAAEIVGRTPSAVSLQMQRLQEAVGLPLIEAKGRARILTEHGERLLGHARRIIAANEDAIRSINGLRTTGTLALGMNEDFVGEAALTCLRAFAEQFPQIRIETLVARTDTLRRSYERNDLDILLSAGGPDQPDCVATRVERMTWLTASDGAPPRAEEPLPLALLDPPCLFRERAVAALAEAGRAYRLVSTSSSLAGVAMAVRAGIAVTPRTARLVSHALAIADDQLDLPELGVIHFSLRARAEASTPVAVLCASLARRLGFRRAAETAASEPNGAP